MSTADVVRLFGKGSKQRIVPVGSYRPDARSTRTWCGCDRCCRRAAGRRPRCSSGCAGPRLSRQSAWLVIQAAAERAGLELEHLAAHLPALLRHPPAAGRRRRARGAGAARPLLGRDHADLHAGHRRHAARRVHDRAPRARAPLSEPSASRGASVEPSRASGHECEPSTVGAKRAAERARHGRRRRLDA